MEDKRIRIKYHQGYDQALNKKLTTAAIALGGEFNDVPLGDGTREMSFEFERAEDLHAFFETFKKLLAEKEAAAALGSNRGAQALRIRDCTLVGLGDVVEHVA